VSAISELASLIRKSASECIFQRVRGWPQSPTASHSHIRRCARGSRRVAYLVVV